MAKAVIIVGYSISELGAPGVYTQTITEKRYKATIIKNTKRWQNGEDLNDDLVLNNTLSILADPFASMNSQNIKYVKWMGASWKVATVTILRPRLILTIGGVWNE